jgi:hypothetical protein
MAGMPMILEHWPTREELGDFYYGVWLKKAIAWVLVTEFCQDEEWYLELERIVKRASTSRDGIRDMVSFMEVFYEGLVFFDFQIHLIVRDVMHLF